MGGFLSSLFSGYSNRKEILMVGLDAAGKTTIRYQLQLAENVTILPLSGSNVETCSYNNMSLTLWDLGGFDNINPLWQYDFSKVQGLIFVIDSNDRSRIKEAKEELQKIRQELTNPTTLIFANKQDMPKTMKVNEIATKLGLNNSDIDSRNWLIQPCSAITGSGLYQGLNWLSSTLNVS